MRTTRVGTNLVFRTHSEMLDTSDSHWSIVDRGATQAALAGKTLATTPYWMREASLSLDNLGDRSYNPDYTSGLTKAILYESDPLHTDEIRALLATIRNGRARAREIVKRVSHSEYQKLVKSTQETVTVRYKKGYRYDRKPVMVYKPVWKIWRYTQSSLAFTSSMALSCKFSAKLRRKWNHRWTSTVARLGHASAERELADRGLNTRVFYHEKPSGVSYTIWKPDPVASHWEVAGADIGLPVYRYVKTPIWGYKKYTRPKWDHIRQIWRIRVGEVRRQLASIRASRLGARKRIRDLSLNLPPASNAASGIKSGHTTEIPVIGIPQLWRRGQERGSITDGGAMIPYDVHLSNGSAIRPIWRRGSDAPACWFAIEDPNTGPVGLYLLYHGDSEGEWVEEVRDTLWEAVYRSLNDMDIHDAKVIASGPFGAHSPVDLHLPVVEVEHAMTYNYWDSTGGYHYFLSTWWKGYNAQRSVQEGYEMPVGRTPWYGAAVVPRLRVDKSNQILFFNKEQELNAAIRNLDVHRKGDIASFNLTRSLVELKDGDQTVKSGASFLSWANAATRRRSRYYISVDAKGTETYYLNRPDVRKLRREGQRVRIRHLTKRTSLKVCAALYLGWRFAIQPTVQDIETIRTYGYKYVTQIRRGLQLATSHLDSSNGGLTTVRRSGTVPLSIEDKIRNARGSHGHISLPHREVQRTDGEELDSFDLKPYYLFIANEENRINRYYDTYTFDRTPGKEKQIPVILSEKYGFMLLDPRVQDEGLNIAGEDYTRDDLLSIVDIENQRIMARLLSESGAAGETVAYDRVKMTRYAIYSYKELLKALKTNTIGGMYESLQPIVNSWELFPLSFICDWFLNTQQIVRTMHNNLSSMMATWHPIDNRIWGCDHHELWVDDLHPDQVPEFSLHFDVDGESGTTPALLVRPSSDPGASYGDTFPKEPKEGTAGHMYVTRWHYPNRLKLRVAWKIQLAKSQVVKTGNSVFIRTPIDERKGRDVPMLKWEVNLNWGKLGSLFAMFAAS